MFLDEISEKMAVINDTADHHLSLIDRYMEMALTELNQKREYAELRYVSENNSGDALCTFSYLYTEAEEGFKERVGKAFDKIDEAFSDLIRDIQTKVNRTILDKSVKKELDIIEKRVQRNPFLKTMKVSWDENSVAAELYTTISQGIGKILNSLSGGDPSANALDSLSEIVNKSTDRSNIHKTEMTVNDALNANKECAKNTVKFTKALEQEGKMHLKTCKNLSENAQSAEVSNGYRQLGTIIVRSMKISANAYINAYTASMRALMYATDKDIDTVIDIETGRKISDTDERQRLKDQAKTKDMHVDPKTYREQRKKRNIQESSELDVDTFMGGMFESFIAYSRKSQESSPRGTQETFESGNTKISTDDSSSLFEEAFDEMFSNVVIPKSRAVTIDSIIQKIMS